MVFQKLLGGSFLLDDATTTALLQKKGESVVLFSKSWLGPGSNEIANTLNKFNEVNHCLNSENDVDGMAKLIKCES